MKKKSSTDFVKSLPKITGNEKASPHLKKTIKVFNGEATGETALIEPTKKDVVKYVGHVKTLNERFFDKIESKKTWSIVALAITTAFIVAVAYWGIKQ
jgi:hypothetical protein